MFLSYKDKKKKNNTVLFIFFLLGPPEIIFLSPNTTVNEGESVTLTCNATGPPPANITWSKNNEDVTFPLNNITREDAGSYQCEADNGVGKPATAGTSITVQCKCQKLQDQQQWKNHKEPKRCIRYIIISCYFLSLHLNIIDGHG